MTLTEPENFLIGEWKGQLFALSLTCVERVVRAVEISALPHSASTYRAISNGRSIVLGIINVQGQSVPVVDISAYFNWPDQAIGTEDFLVLLQVSQQLLALPANQILEVVPEQAFRSTCRDAGHSIDNAENDNASSIQSALEEHVCIWAGHMVWSIDVADLLRRIQSILKTVPN